MRRANQRDYAAVFTRSGAVLRACNSCSGIAIRHIGPLRRICSISNRGIALQRGTGRNWRRACSADCRAYHPPPSREQRRLPHWGQREETQRSAHGDTAFRPRRTTKIHADWASGCDRCSNECRASRAKREGKKLFGRERLFSEPMALTATQKDAYALFSAAPSPGKASSSPGPLQTRSVPSTHDKAPLCYCFRALSGRCAAVATVAS